MLWNALAFIHTLTLAPTLTLTLSVVLLCLPRHCHLPVIKRAAFVAENTLKCLTTVTTREGKCGSDASVVAFPSYPVTNTLSYGQDEPETEFYEPEEQAEDFAPDVEIDEAAIEARATVDDSEEKTVVSADPNQPAKPSSDADKKIPPEKRSTTRYMTKYERARVLGTRALQIRYGFSVTHVAGGQES